MKLPKLGASNILLGWIAVTIVASIAGAIWKDLPGLLALVPARIWEGEAWRLVTWVVVATNPIELALTVYMMYRLGGVLGELWGEARLLRVVGEVVFVTGIVVTVICAARGDTKLVFVGGICLLDVLMILFGRTFPDERLMETDSVPLTGRQLVWSTLGFNIVLVFSNGLTEMLPELVASAVAIVYPVRRIVLR